MLLEYVGEIRVSLELISLLGSLWWAIRTFALASSRKDALLREEDDAHSQLGTLQASTKKLNEAVKKVREKVIPGQATILNQLRNQITSMEKDLEDSQLPAKVRLYQEVKEFYTQEPDARYFRASNWVPVTDDTL